MQLDVFVLEKADAKRYTLGIIYEPDVVDTQGEFAKAEDIEVAAWAFLERMQSMAKSASVVLQTIIDAEAADEPRDLEIDVTEFEPLLKAQGLDDEHQQVEEPLGMIVESYLAPADFTVGKQRVRKGSWLLGVVWTPEMFAKIKAGERTGLSMFGRMERRMS